MNIRHLLFLFASYAALSSWAGTNVARNLPPECTMDDGSDCGCEKTDEESDGAGETSEDNVEDECIKVKVGLGRTTPWTGSIRCALKIFADDDSPSVFTPESVYPVFGYAFKRIGNKVLSDRKTPKEVVFSRSNGEPVHFVFEDGESLGRPDPGRHVKMDERLQMVDAEGWATVADPVYWDLYVGDGTVRRFLASDMTNERGRFVSLTDAHGRCHTADEMGVDIVYDADGVRQFLTPSRLADVTVCDGGYDIRVYPLRSRPEKASGGTYVLPHAELVRHVKVRSAANGRHAVVSVRRGGGEFRDYVFEYVKGDWSLMRPSGVREEKERSIEDSRRASIVKGIRSPSDRLLSRVEKNYVWQGWGFAMTNKVEGVGDVTRTTSWNYYTSGPARGRIRSRLEQSGLRTEYKYDDEGRKLTVARSGPDMMTETVTYSYASVDPSDAVPPVDTRPRTVVRTLDGVECERTYYVYSPLTNVVERVGTQGAPYGGTKALRTVTAFYPVVADDIRSGRIRSVRHENGKVDLYDYALATNVWTETVTHLHEQLPDPVSGKTTRDIILTSARGERIEQRTEAFIDGAWHTIARERRTYNEQGKVVRSENLAGQVTTTEWDCCHKIMETKPDGSTTTWDYDAEGRRIATSRLIPMTLTNVAWLTTCYAYDDLGRQTATWTTNYAERVGLPATQTRYDALGRVIVRTDVLGNDTTTCHSPDGRTVSVVNPNTSTRVSTRSPDGDLLTVIGTAVTPEFHTHGIQPDGTRWSKTVQGETADSPRFTKRYENMLGQVVREERSGFRGAVLATAHIYDGYSRLIRTQPDGEPLVAYEYDTHGSRIATIRSVPAQEVGCDRRIAPQSEDLREWRKQEVQTHFALADSAVWQVQTNVISCSDATIAPLVDSRWTQLSGLTAANPLCTRTIDIRGNATQSWTEFANGATTAKRRVPEATNIISSRSRYGIELETVSLSAVTNTLVFDVLGRKTVRIDGRGNATRTEYDAFGRQYATYDGAGNPTHYAYDRLGQLMAITNALGHATVYEYDLRGHKTYEGGATYPVRYTYDIFGNKATMMTYRDESKGRDSGDVTTWLYDEASGVVTNKVYADGKGPKYEYDANGRLVKRTWARGIDTIYAYDGWGNLTNTTYFDDTPTVSLWYDALGRQVEAHDAAGITTFVYDAFGANTNETVVGVAGTNILERFTDFFGRDAGYALNGVRQTTLGYDPETGRLTTMGIASADESNTHSPTSHTNSFSWDYLPGSDLKRSLTYPNGLTAIWTYGKRNELLEVDNASSAGTISRYAYSYDALGRRISSDKFGSAFTTSDTYTYFHNERNELVKAMASVDVDYRYDYVFDDIGNRESSSERGMSSTYVGNNLNQYTMVAREVLSALYEGFVPKYDDDGNQTVVRTSTGVWQVVYNGENRPILWKQGVNMILMSYDRLGRRVTKNDRHFVYDHYLQIADNNGNAYVWDRTESVATRPLVWLSCASVAYYVHDGNKNVSEVIAAAGSLDAHYEYAPFGAITISRGPSATANPWRFSSEHFEDDTATVYYNYRHYEPARGRWMQRDPISNIESANLYCWILNRSSGMDVLGLWRKKEGTSSVWIAEKGDTLRGLARRISQTEADWPCLWPVGKTKDHGYPDTIWPCDEYSSENLDATSGVGLTIALQAGLGMYDRLPGAITLPANLVPTKIRDASGEGGTPIHQLLVGGHGGVQTQDNQGNVLSSYSVSQIVQLKQQESFLRASQKKGPPRCWFTRTANVRISGCTTESVAQQFAHQLLRNGAFSYGTDQSIGTAIENGNLVLYYNYDVNGNPANSSEYYSSVVWKSFGGRL